MKQLLLDVDGTLIDTSKLWSLTCQQFQIIYPDKLLSEFLAIYQENYKYGRQDLVIDAGTKQFDQDFWRVFYEVDFRSCLDATGWDNLVKAAAKLNIKLHIYSEGSISRAFVLPEENVSYQVHKVSQLDLNLPSSQIHLYQDKIASLPSLLSSLEPNQGGQLGCLDDKWEILEKIHQVGPDVKLFWLTATSVTQSFPWISQKVSSLSGFSEVLVKYSV